MNSADKQAVLHCLKSMIDEEVCEECPLYGTTGTDHCEKDCVRLAINALSSAENPNKWIPCSERLPEKRGCYIVTEKVFSPDDREHKGRYNTMVEQVEYYDGKWKRANFFEVVAWMPLPELYKQEVEDE